jgi:formate dehydrogenase subunit gamma
MAAASVARFSRTERTLHWVHATAFFTLLASGLCLYLPALSELVGRRDLFKTVHLYTAVAWLVALALIVAAGDRRGLRATWREVELFDAADRSWFHDRGAPTGRFNAGQKLFAVSTIAFAILFSFTGTLLWYGERDTSFRFDSTLLIHDWLMYVSVLLVIGHVYMVVRHHPGRHARPDDRQRVHAPGGVVQHGGGGERPGDAGRAGAARGAEP